jgi:uncharacterized membrane protein
MKRSVSIFFAMLMVLSAGAALGQKPRGLTLWTQYPAQSVQAGETVVISLTLSNRGLPPQIVRVQMREVAEGWKASLSGGGRPVQAVYVDTDNSASLSLKLEPPAGVQPGTYRFVVHAQGQGAQSELPIELTVEAQLPPQLQFEVELPTRRGSSTTTFRYSATLTNKGEQEATVNLEAEAPEGFQVTFKLRFGSEEVTSLPIKPGESKSLDIEVRPPKKAQAGEYPIRVRALGGQAQAALDLKAVITGQADLNVTTPDGRLSAQATAGRENSLKILVRNTGSAPARDVELSSFPPAGWTVEFDPKTIAEIAPNGSAEVTAKIKPSDKTVAGDYMLTITARSENLSDSKDFRITVVTSTLWGIVGIGIIVIALGVVGWAVSRFGRR